MSEEKNYFICRNEECQPKNDISGGTVFFYEKEESENTFACPYCGTSYLEYDGTVYLIWGSESLVIESGQDYTNFRNQFESSLIYFPKLILKNIEEYDTLLKKMAFSKCVIGDLILENINITSAYYPILFFDCVITKARFSNCKITKTNRNSYKSLYSFYAINFFGSSVLEEFEIEKCDTSLVISASNVECPLHVSKKSNIELVLCNNVSSPEIKTEKDSQVFRKYESLGRSPAAKKKVSSEGKSIHNLNINELHIDPDIASGTLIENCFVSNLVFPDESNIKGKLVFRNCSIENIINTPYSFEQDVVFQACTFKEDFLLIRSSFKQALVFEFCEFEGNTNFNDLKIEEDFFLSYSQFNKDVFITGNKYQNYFKCQVNAFSGHLTLEDNVVSRDMNIRSVKSGGSLHIIHNEVGGYLIARQVILSGSIEIDMLKADALTINDTFVSGAFDLSQSYLGTDLRIERLEVLQNTNFTDNILGGCIFMKRSEFEGSLSILSIQSRLNFLTNLNVKDSCSFSSSTFSQQSYVSHSLLNSGLTWDTMNCHNISFNYNCLLKDFLISQMASKSLTLEMNMAFGNVDINSSSTGDISISNNYVNGSLKTNNCKTADVNIEGSIINNELSILYTNVVDLSLTANEVDSLKVSNSNAEKAVVLDNIISSDIKLNHCSIKKGLDVHYNVAEQFSLYASKAGIIEHFRNYFSGSILIDESETENIEIKDCQFRFESKLSNLKARNITVDDNSILGNLRYDIVQADDIFIRRNNISNLVFINYPKCVDLIFQNNSLDQLQIMRGSFSGISISDSAINTHTIYQVTTSRDISIVKNFMKNFNLENTLSNDIMFNNNYVVQRAGFDDVSANDIFIKGNQLEKMEEAKRGEAKPNSLNYGLRLNKCKVEGEIEIYNNTSIEIVQIYQTFADIITCEHNYTKSLEVRSGKYRQLIVQNSREVRDFLCNNVTVEKDAQFHNNYFYGTFNMLFCNIGNDLEIFGNEFTSMHKLYKSNILGSLIYKEKEVPHYPFSFDPTGINFNFTFNLFQNYDQFYPQKYRSIDTIFNSVFLIRENKLNLVSMKGMKVNSIFTFENNEVQGSLEIGNRDLPFDEKDITFANSLFISENRVNSAAFSNLCFESSASLQYNNFRGDLSFRDTVHKKSLDFTGCFVGGTFEIHKSKTCIDDGDLILDNAFIDKRLSFNNYTPQSISFINATFNGFDIPQDWAMRWKKLIDKSKLSKYERKGIIASISYFFVWLKNIFIGEKHAYIFKEDILKKGNANRAELSYNFMKEFYLDDDVLNTIPARWKELDTEIFSQKKKLDKLDQTHQRKNNLEDRELVEYFKDLFKSCIQKEFLPVYYNHYYKEELSELIEVSAFLADAPNNYKNEETKADFAKLKDFFSLFTSLLKSFQEHTFYPLREVDSWKGISYKESLQHRLEEQYHVLRHIWGDNGELKEEDITYYKWMHYKNLSDMHSASFLGKVRPMIRYLLYEKVFGWGVDLPRIVRNTFIMVFIFAGIYFTMFQTNPDLEIFWDEERIKGTTISLWDSGVFALQTTFSAGLGDWVPLRSGSIKIPMTINAILGVLFVTFLIGAYGRKMLR